ncbi:MAG TPA: hypothetical protein VFZ09_14385 [Archangium sp.]|uniref:hypothetical protein n=1 Tax=Archangium sp. TaxID=1872627 RepID=UPI002E37AAB6|nr:hypothetical protein [Archangium sp.]HEX5747429.1 hypothetical protein [Archangium sp.]
MTVSRLAGGSRLLWVWVPCLLGLSCVSARSEPVPAAASVDAGPGSPDAGLAPVDAGLRCVPLTCLKARARCGVISDGCGGSVDCGQCSQPCAPEEMNCCGICIPRSEGRCPDNIHCRPLAPPVEAEQ